MPYAYLTFAAARAQLAALLSDTGNVFWTDAELGLYIREAMRTWGAMSGFWKERGVFNTSASTFLYDIPSLLPTLRAYTVTDTDLVAEIQYHLLEPSTGNSWTGSTQFSLADVTNALQRRRDQFLLDTGIVISQLSLHMPASPVGRQNLPDSTIAVRRAIWKNPDGRYSNLWRDDEWGMTSFYTSWTTIAQAVPDVYSVSVTPPLTVQVGPPPNDSGQLELLVVNSGAALDPTSGVLIGVPDDYTPFIKWGAMADLLGRDGPALDPLRAGYCEKRYLEGVQLAQDYPSAMQVLVNDSPVSVDSLANLDAYSPGWQNKTGEPYVAVMAGQNLIGFINAPDGVYSITLDVVRNAPIPTADGDPIQVSRETLDSLLEYAQHLASFKMGGAEFTATSAQYDRLIRTASVYNENLRARTRNLDAMTNRAQLEEMSRPMRKSKAEVKS